MNRNHVTSDADIDHILEEVHEKQSETGPLLSQRGENHDDELDSILASLGMGEKPRLAVQFTDKTQISAEKKVPQKEEKPVPRANATGKFVEPPRVETQQTAAQPQKSTVSAQRAVPVQPAAPISQETSTLELPSIKSFTVAQEKRKADIEAAAAKAALERAGVRPNIYEEVRPAEEAQGNAMFGEVDDRFRAFFSKSVAQTSPEAEQAAYEANRKKGRFKRFLTRAVMDEDEAFLTGEFDTAPIRRPEKVAVEVKRNPPAGTSATTDKAADFAALMRGGDATEEIPAQKAQNKFKHYTITMPLEGDGTEEIKGVRSAFGPTPEQTEAGEYNHLSDAPAVVASLKNMRITRILRMAVTGIVTLVLLYFGFSARAGWLPPIAALDPHTAPFGFLLLNFVLTAIAGVTCLTTLSTGVTGLWARPTTDTFPAVATVAALIQTLGYLFASQKFDPETVTLFAPVATLLLFSNTLGKWLQSKVVSDNFDMASAGFEHAAAFLVPSRELARKVTNGIGEPEPTLLVSRPAGLVKGFLRQSFSGHLNDPVAQKLSYVLCATALLCGIICGVRAQSFLAALSGFAAAFCIGAPLASSLVYAVPALLLQQAAAKVGAVVPGPSAVQELGKTNVVLLNARDLFPASCVRLHGIKIFERERIDLAILYATSLLAQNCDTLRDAFMALVDNKKNMLYKVDSPTVEPGYGFTGWMDNRRVIVGNREMMKRHDIEIPSLDYERKYTKDGERSPIYLAVSGKASGMFLVSYLPDESAQKVLDDLGASGINVVLQTDDFNITAPLVSATYRLDKTTVKVLSQQERALLASVTDYAAESEGLLTHIPSCTSFVGGLRAAAGAAVGEKLACFVQMAAIFFSALLCVVLSFSLGITGIALAAVVLYHLAWCILTVVLPLIKRT